MSGNYLTPKFWYTGYTGCTILVHRVHRVHHFGTQGAPFWYTGYTGCTILVHRVHHFGTQGAPFWYTGCTILVHRVHHFGTQGAPFWYTGCTITREISFRITSQLPKNEPDSGNTPPDHHGTFEKSPTKPPPGLTARLLSPHTDRSPAAKNHDGNGPHQQGQSSAQGLRTTTPQAGSPTTAEPQTPPRWRQPGSATQAPPAGPTGSPWPFHRTPAGNTIQPVRTGRRHPIPRSGHKTGITRSRLNRTHFTVTSQNILTSSAIISLLRSRPGPPGRA